MKKISLLALALSAAACTASAGELGYTSVELGYQQARQNTSNTIPLGNGATFGINDVRPKGYYLNGSIELGSSPFYAFGSYARGTDTFSGHINGQFTTDAGPVTIDSGRLRPRSAQQRYEVGLGYYYAINPRLNLISEMSYINYQDKIQLAGIPPLNLPPITDKSHGNDLRVAFGVDSMLTNNLQGWAKLNYTKGDSMLEETVKNGVYSTSSDGKLGTSLGMQYKFNSMWGITGQLDFASGANSYKMGVKASF